MNISRRYPFVKVAGFLLYLFSLFYFWRTTITYIIELTRIPGNTFLKALEQLPLLTRTKIADIEMFHQFPGPWLVEPDYIYFLLLLYLLVLIIVLFRLQWVTLPMIIAGLVFPQFTLILAGIWKREYIVKAYN